VLCEEPLRGVAFSLLDSALDGNAVQRGGGQIIPTARRVMYAAQHLSAPRLMEPVLLVDLRGPEHTHLEVQPPRPRPCSQRCPREKQQPVGGQESSEWHPRYGPTPPCGVFATAADERGRARPQVKRVVKRRRGVIVESEQREGTPLFAMRVFLPVAESLGFEDEVARISEQHVFAQVPLPSSVKLQR
jgi:hypothetical protein